ncbi:MAG TPA: DUF547 domain-containing protein [Drouetiella sp.]|jgi:Protein of unknown function, DUF547
MQLSTSRKTIPLILLGIGAALVCFHILVNGAAWIKSSFTKIDHPASYRFASFDQLLHEVVKGDSVDYKLAKKSPLLNKAIDELSVVAPDKLQSDEEKACYWINTYNLLMLKLLTDKYPIDSPRRLGNGVSFTKFTVGGDTYSARDIEDLKLNQYFKRNPLLAFLICGGSKGDPPLLDHVIEPASLKGDAEKALDNFANNPVNTKWDEVSNVFYISPYFQRYDDYFVAYFESPHILVASRLKKSVPAANVSMLKRFFRDYDHRLNDVGSSDEKTVQSESTKSSESKTKSAESKTTDPSESKTTSAESKGTDPSESKTKSGDSKTTDPSESKTTGPSESKAASSTESQTKVKQ